MRKINQNQADELQGSQFMPDCYFNPIQDSDGDWVVSEEEVAQMTPEAEDEFPWLKSRPEKAHKPTKPNHHA